ncbi:hypothetical protein APED_32340 [Acanthopleuribacter pedis]
MIKRRVKPGFPGRILKGFHILAPGTTIENGRTLGAGGSRTGKRFERNQRLRLALFSRMPARKELKALTSHRLRNNHPAGFTGTRSVDIGMMNRVWRLIVGRPTPPASARREPPRTQNKRLFHNHLVRAEITGAEGAYAPSARPVDARRRLAVQIFWGPRISVCEPRRGSPGQGKSNHPTRFPPPPGSVNRHDQPSRA